MGRLFLLALLTSLLMLLAARSAGSATLFGLVNTGELFASSDAGASWTIRSTLPVRDAVALIAGGSSSELFLASESGSIYRSTDAGDNWTGVGALTASDVTALVGLPGKLLVLTASGSVYRSADAGASWTAVGTITASDMVSACRLGLVVFALAKTGGVYRSDDEGETWSAVGAITTSEAVELVGFGLLYAITGSGTLYLSLDDGVSFAAVSTLSQVGTTTLVPGTAELIAALGTGEVAATPDASVWTWRGAINQLTVRALANDTPSTTSVGPGGPRALELRVPYPNPASGTMQLALDLSRESWVKLEVLDLSGRRVALLLAGERVPAGALERTWQPRGLAPAVYTLRAEVNGRSESRRFVWLGGR